MVRLDFIELCFKDMKCKIYHIDSHKNILLIFIFLFTSTIFSQKISSLKDSVLKYKDLNSQKALDFSFQALNLPFSEEDVYDLFDINYLIGEIYFFNKFYEKSLQYLSQSLTIYESLSSDQKINKNVKKPPWLLSVIGNIYYENENYEKAKTIYKEAIDNFSLYGDKFLEDKTRGTAIAELNLALISKKQFNYPQAESYYKNILDRQKDGILNDKYVTTILLTYLEIMDFYFISGKDELGVKYFNLSTKLFEKENVDIQIAPNYSRIISRYAVYLKNKKQYRKAIKYFEKSKNLLENFNSLIPDINVSISECYFEIGDFEKAEKTYNENLKNKDLSFKDKIKNFKGLGEIYSVQNRNKDLINVYGLITKLYEEKRNIISVNDLDNQMIISQKQKEINENILKNIRNSYFITVLILVSIIIIIILVFNYNFQKVKSSKLEMEKKQISSKLDSKNRELVSKANFILQRNEYLKNIKIKLDKSQVNDQSFKRISREINDLINSDKSYREFDKTFINVYPEFYKYLNVRFKLSQTYLRLAAYIKMNQTNNEIAKITGVSLRTVETQRYRLSKKLNLNKYQDLNSFLQNL